MSETKDTFLYNFYDYISSIFIYSHVKTFLIDPKRQKLEKFGDAALLISTLVCFSAVIFKFIVIFIYFFLFQTTNAFINFLTSLFRVKCKINFWTSFKNGFFFVMKNLKRTLTFNFSLYQNLGINLVMILSYFFYLITSTAFFWQNFIHAEDSEKSENYLGWFYSHFESILLIQLLCCSFYACGDHNDMNLSIISAFGIFIFLNLILYLSFLIKEKIENVEGIYEHLEPQLLTNTAFNFIFSILYGKCVYNFFFYQYNGHCK